MRHAVVAALVMALVGTVLAVHLAVRAQSADVSRCERFAAASVMRGQAVSGAGERVVVIGDSWAAGLGLEDSTDSWPSRLPGRIHVAGFSGSGFSAGASACGKAVSFATRAPAALHGGADLVVVEGGLNDYDQPEAEIRDGFHRLMRILAGQRVVVVGPASAPLRASAVPRIDRLLADLAAEYDLPYLRTSAWTLPYLPDRLHLTAAGHRQFGDALRAALAALP